MRRFLMVLLIVLLAAALAACSGQSAGTTTASSAPSLTAEPAAALETNALEPVPYAPMDIFGSMFNPYADAGFSEDFDIYAASFSKGSAKLEGKNPYTLSMTAGETAAAIAFLADLAGLSEDEKNSRTDEFGGGGFCEFQGDDGAVFTVRRTDAGDDRYAYIDGCHIDITVDISPADMEKYTSFVRDNYSLNALAPITAYLNIAPDYAQCDFHINLHKKEAGVSVVYQMADAGAVLHDIAGSVECDWYDAEGGKMGLFYGMITLELSVDSRGEGFYVVQTVNAFDTALSAYIEPEISLTKLGFGFGEDGVCGVYEQREPHYKSVAITKPEWGAFSDGWNIEFMDMVNGYGLRITYHASEDRYHISLDKDGVGCAYDSYPAKDEYGWEYPDLDTVHQMFNDAFGTKEKELYFAPLAYFEQFVQERFGMSITELYALPKQ